LGASYDVAPWLRKLSSLGRRLGFRGRCSKLGAAEQDVPDPLANVRVKLKKDGPFVIRELRFTQNHIEGAMPRELPTVAFAPRLCA